jgi:hypothetical protein
VAQLYTQLPLATLDLDSPQRIYEYYLADVPHDRFEAHAVILEHSETGQSIEGTLEPDPKDGTYLTLDYNDILSAGSWTLRPVPTITQRITTSVLSDYQGQESLKIITPQATYIYHLAGAGFASILDQDGQDWLNFRPYGGSDGKYRGIPNLVYPEGHFHPGGTSCKTHILRQSPLKVTLVSESLDGQWQCAWEILPTFARLTVLKAPKPYWFLYEGTPAGRMDESAGFCVRADRIRTPLAQPWDGVLAAPRWLYFGHCDASQVLYLLHHEVAEGLDSYWPMEQNMTVFGFGRKNLQSFLTTVPARFTVGLCDQKIVEQVLQDHCYTATAEITWHEYPKEV